MRESVYSVHAIHFMLTSRFHNNQVQPNLYKGVFDGWRIIYRAEGLRGVFTGFGPTLVGYSLQGMGKYGFYEFFKHDFTLLAEEEKAHKYRFELYLAASAAAEVAADVLLCPVRTVNVLFCKEIYSTDWIRWKPLKSGCKRHIRHLPALHYKDSKGYGPKKD